MSARRPWALVTGASSGLGEEFARQLAAQGYDVVLTARRRDRLERLAAEIEGRACAALVVESDLAAPGAAAALLRELEGRGIELDVLVNNAGVGLYGTAIEQPPAQVDAMLRLNVLALTELSLVVGRRMAERGAGAIVNVSSTAGFQPDPWFAAYGASKAYVTSFSLALAQELAPRGVRVLAHCPGPTRTEFNTAAGVRAARDADWLYMSAQRCVAIALGALRRRRRLVVTGWLNRIAAFLARRSPLALVTRVNAWLLAPGRTRPR
jgi:short-subunit dehydrogenase